MTALLNNTLKKRRGWSRGDGCGKANFRFERQKFFEPIPSTLLHLYPFHSTALAHSFP